LFKPFNGFADNIPVYDGYVRMPDIPGIGFEAKSDLFHLLRQVVPT
jgi:D(-)-tartrate dehydratase